MTLTEAFTKLFPPVAKRVLDELRGDRRLETGDDVQNTLQLALAYHDATLSLGLTDDDRASLLAYLKTL